MLYLSKKSDFYVRAEDIAQDMKIPKSFLIKILKQLEKSGLVQLKRGVGGGIRLLRHPSEISIYDIVVAIEKEVVLNRCLTNYKVCGFIHQCPVHPVWAQLREKLIQALKDIKFQDLSAKVTAL